MMALEMRRQVLADYQPKCVSTFENFEGEDGERGNEEGKGVLTEVNKIAKLPKAPTQHANKPHTTTIPTQIRAMT
jgi:hypothetical protein